MDVRADYIHKTEFLRYSAQRTALIKGEYLSEESVHRVYGSTVVDISITPPSFKPVSLYFLRFLLSKIPKQVFFNPINIF